MFLFKMFCYYIEYYKIYRYRSDVYYSKFDKHYYVDFHWSLVMRKPDFAYANTKTQISFAVTAKLISAFVFATWIVQSLCFLNPKFQASNHLLWLYSQFCVGPGRKPRRRVFSQRDSLGSMQLTYSFGTL